ncbi:MAG: hypothetical protein IJ047_01515 [Paludibacteraceae bacterium]|nr:hypothetical protein [Paludibacteraceae bacterium]
MLLRNRGNIVGFVLLIILNVCACVCAHAQTDTIRYVHPNGAYEKDGRSWANAKNKVQDAINDLHEYLTTNHLTSGSVYIAAGTYVPTESTESSGGSMLNTSFKIYSGIHVYGGFNPDDPESKPEDRIMANDKKQSENWSDQSGIGTTSGTEIASQWDFKYKTILSGNHSTTPPTFTFDSIRGRFNTAYPASSFHVVWFATNGKYEGAGVNDSTAGHYCPLEHPASVDGCVISSGNAATKSTTLREHTAYGGGVYMVGNSYLRNCIVERCNATMRGGGIYADGGGVIEFCYVQTCQTTGVGVYEGYGGGVCIDQDGSIGHSHITNCAARCGGGLMIAHIPGEYPWEKRGSEPSQYAPFTAACVVNNNTASAEGGGIYLANGGTVNHATVCANNCIGPDVTYYGRRHGRSGGIYVRNCGMIFNSVFWGNRCDVNNDIQFASVRQRISDGYQTFVYHSAFMNHDITDWTGVTKERVFSLDKNNMPSKGSISNHPCFFHPSVNPNNWAEHDHDAQIYGAGVFLHLTASGIPGPRIWHLTSYSAIDQKGVQVSEAVQNVSPWLIHAHTDYGVVSNPYEPSSTLGALVRKPDPITYVLVEPQGLEGRKGGEKIPTLFIDPNRPGVYDEDGVFLPQDKEGNSWDTPICDIGEAVEFFRKCFKDADPSNRYYRLPKQDGTNDSVDYRTVQILVKEGTLTTVGPGNYVNKNLRTAAIVTYGHMRFYGGYPGDLTGTETEGRNPHAYRSTITANVTGISGEQGYINNSAHLFALVNADSVVVDGFTLRDANTHGVYSATAANDGGGVVVNNSTIDPSRRIDMVGNQLRNCVIANCTSHLGAGIYVNGEWSKTGGEICYAELKVTNTIIRNNKASVSYEATTTNGGGIVTANGRAYICLDHCDIVNNAGDAFLADNRYTDGTTMAYRGFIRMDNSLVFSNGTKVLDDYTQLGKTGNGDVTSAEADGQAHVYGTYNMFDADLASKPNGFFSSGYSLLSIDGFVPAGVTSKLTDDKASLPADSANRHNAALFTRSDVTAKTYPSFINPMRTIGNSPSGDKALYGGTASYTPMNTNPCVNAAHVNGYKPIENYDRTDVITRDRGGAPDLGAVENTDLPPSGTVLYVTPNGAGKMDGSSWDNAIAGNTVYVLNEIAGPALATGDQIDAESNRVLDSGGNPILTTNSKYNGGWGRVWFTDKQIGATSTTTITKTWTTEKNVYDDGTKVGDEDILQNNVESESSNTVNVPGSAPGGFVAGYDYDPRYPYGEISGASRSFWRANPYHNGTDWNNASDYGNRNAFINACNAAGWINNTRAERYVGGLQYAVEMASAYNKAHKDSVQVWVGAGTYNDYKGFVMRDSVTVLGGFPANKYKAPGMSERQALMDTVLNIPKSKPAEKLDAADYETILQISDINPDSTENHLLAKRAVKYWDDDYSYTEQTQTTQYEYYNRTIVHHYKAQMDSIPGPPDQDTYMKYANMTAGTPTLCVTKTNSHKGSVVNGFQYYTFGEASDGKDCWNMKYPAKTYYVADIVNDGNANDKERNIYDPETNEQLTGTDAKYKGNWIFIGNGSLTDLVLWQDLSNVPKGKYQISVDIAGGYRNAWKSKDTTMMFFRVYDADNTICAEVNIKTRGSYANNDNADNNRNMAYRHVLTFHQPTTGPMRIAVEVEDGVRNLATNIKDASLKQYATEDGGDPDPIPCEYKYEQGCSGNAYGGRNPNRREFWLSNIQIRPYVEAETYVLDETEDSSVENDEVPHEDPVISKTKTYTRQTHRTPLRKRVLTMPDVCVPTYGAGSVGDPASSNRGKYGDDLSHTHRVFGPSKAKRSSWKNADFVREDPNYVEYNEANWDGFTIRHGLIHEEGMGHGGGAGVNMYEGAHLRNCIVINNMSKSGRVKGGGIYCDGATATIEGCFVLNNISTKQNANTTQNQVFSGGMFLYEGTCFNSLFANNYSFGSAGGVGFCVGKFYNNTIAYNTCDLNESGHINGGAISVATESTPNLFVANTIVYGNKGMAMRERTESAYQGKNLIHPFINCYIQTDVAFTQETYRDNIINYSDGKYGKGNVLLQEGPSAATTPFVADFNELGNYVAGRAASLNDFRLRDDVPCVNHGTEEFAGDLLDVLERKHSKTEAQVKEMPIYKSVEAAQLPDNDVAFAKRVQDCQIDMGAYEFNAAYSIKPDTTTHPGQAIYYVTFNAPGGDASASSPANAACKQKLQQVLDAAGRYKYALMTENRYNKGATTVGDKTTIDDFVAQEPNKYWTVEVWLEGDNTNSTTSDTYGAYYTPTRSTKNGTNGYQDNTLDYSFIVPHGVQLKGGYTSDFTGRDPLTYRTVLSGNIISNTGAEGQTYHVVTFTNDLFDTDENKMDDGGQLAVMTDAKDRAVLDGLFIEDGYANASDDEGRIGGAAVVTDFAHVRNCVIRNNDAAGEGGGLYLKPYALVSGCIIRDNSANIGGGIYVESPERPSNDSLAYVYASTICANTATASAGGIWFDNTYVRVNSTALWHNEANDNANVSGVFSRSSSETKYPFNFCAVESRRLEGQANVELSPRETEGVRWDRTDSFLIHNIQYYPIEMSSTLSRAGMTYRSWRDELAVFPTLDTVDIAGVSRLGWTATGEERGYAWGSDQLITKNNDFIEIGARAINKNYAINVDENYVMRRLYVMHTDLINSEAARALQDNAEDTPSAHMYRQMGSCILNPFHRLGDAFDYVIAARKKNAEKYRGMVFEIYIEQGTYYPYHNAYGEQDQVRNNTFLVPEALYVIGGVDSRPDSHWYGQEGFYDEFSGQSYGDTTVNVTVAGYEIKAASRDEIRIRDKDHRPMRDNNLNSVIEPWELERQTILSGNAVAGEDFTHVYHVITMNADSLHVGPQPYKYRSVEVKDGRRILSDPIPFDRPDLFHEESEYSILARTTEFDGIQITGGYANHLDASDTLVNKYVKNTYFRGGGIFVDGFWTAEMQSDKPNMTEAAKYNIPIIVENCFFNDNMAANGGALYSNGGIYMYGCHFTQNYSQGPITKLDQKFIPWSSGGCIATNALCDISNSLFANNEARRGLYPLTKEAEEDIPDADARQGFGGVISAAAQAYLRAVNCHFVRNKAVAFPAIYNFWANNHYHGDATHSRTDSMQFAFNCIFWGNEVFEVEDIGKLENVEAPDSTAIKDFNLKYKGSRAGVFHYDSQIWGRYEKYYHEYDSLYHYWTSLDRGEERDTFHTATIDKLMQLRAVGDSLEGMFFCSYRQGYGPTGMRPNKDGYLLTQDEQRAFVDPRKMDVKTRQINPFVSIENYDSLFTYVHGNNNVIINRLNTATDGPNFKQPTFVAGIDGYMQNADWLQARMNITTDQGWGSLSQTVKRGIGWYITSYTGSTHYATKEEATAAALAELQKTNPSATAEDVKEHVIPISGIPVATFDDTQAYPGAMYNWLARRYGAYTSQVNPPLPLKDQQYMAFTRTNSDTETSGVMNRISRNPRMGIEDVFIDMGVYEYQYVQLDLEGRDIDTMWVATKEKGAAHDGITWESPTTDLQYAIDMLMSSRNNHDKYVCFLGDEEGYFTPNNVLNNRRTFMISSTSLEPLLPDSAEADTDYGVKSLTFLGGYSYDVKNAQRDPVSNPAILSMPDIGIQSQRNQLFVVEDMNRQWEQANYLGQSTTHDTIVIPITFDGLTFINPYSTRAMGDGEGLLSNNGGAAIYYRWQRAYDEEAGTGTITHNMDFALRPDTATVDGTLINLPKLTISNCTFMDNGDWTVKAAQRSPAVRIDHGGGSSLIVNSLFHSNAGEPIYAHKETGGPNLVSVPNDVTIINSTFALNGGHITLESDHNEVHNSLIWLDDLVHDTTTMLQFGPDTAATLWGRGSDEDKNRLGITDSVTHNAFWGCFRAGDALHHNDSLSTENNNVTEGPGFVLPFVTAANSEQRRERNFRLNPSTKTSNQANGDIYTSRVLFRYPVAERPALDTQFDLAHKPRLSGGGLERGAYECLAQIQRVLYVRAEAMDGDGSSWEKAFGQGQLQNAIDAAAVYTYLNQGAVNRESRKAYVFVQGSSQSLGSIEARDGVYVYGSLPTHFTDTATATPIVEGSTEKEFTDDECQRFVNYVRAYESGVAASGASSYITSVRIEGDPFQTGFLLDGFVITNTTNAHTTPVIINNDLSAVRNCLLVNNKVEGHPLADVQKGLLYNSLIYGDSASTLVRVGANGLALNNTIVSEIESVTPIDTTEARAGAVRNNISLNSQLSTINCFAPYMTAKNPYTLPSYLTNNPSLAYQLYERSDSINAGLAYNDLPALFDDYKADHTIDFSRDRDVLGNPRLIGTTVDMGALEAWYIAPKTAVEITAITNIVGPGASSGKPTAFTNNYGGNNYPHPGSVVYLMDSAVMTMQYENTDFRDLKENDIIFNPGYMLLSSGASFYGNGHNVQLAYVAAEKRFVNQRYSMTAWPFDYDIQNITVSGNPFPVTPPSGGLGAPFTTYTYNGTARSAKDYVFQSDNSDLWIRIDTTNRSATEGYLMDFGSVMTDTTLRFTSFAPSAGQYVYVEDTDDKEIYLTQYDHRDPSGAGTGFNFTRQEDMGWNMKGLPWLVSEYRTDTILEDETYLRQMYIPHVFYRMDGAVNYAINGDQVIPDRSWDKGTVLPMGTAFLTQTATQSENEKIVFHLPKYGRNKRVARPILSVTESTPKVTHAPAKSAVSSQPSVVSRQQSAFVTLFPDSTADKTVRYSYGRDGVSWRTDERSPQLYILDARRTSGISLLGAAPTEVDIPLGLSVPNLTTGEVIFSLPQKEAFADYAYVWLIDYEKNKYTNLLEEPYTASVEQGENTRRFAVRIGGFPKTDKNGSRQYVVYTFEGTLYVRGLVAGDRITVYSPSGQLVHQAISTGYEYSTPLSPQNGYVVKVNDKAHKVLNM